MLLELEHAFGRLLMLFSHISIERANWSELEEVNILTVLCL